MNLNRGTINFAAQIPYILMVVTGTLVILSLMSLVGLNLNTNYSQDVNRVITVETYENSDSSLDTELDKKIMDNYKKSKEEGDEDGGEDGDEDGGEGELSEENHISIKSTKKPLEKNFHRKYAPFPEEMEKACSQLGKATCKGMSASCIWIKKKNPGDAEHKESCVAGNYLGPTYLSDKGGALYDIHSFHHNNTCKAVNGECE